MDTVSTGVCLLSDTHQLLTLERFAILLHALLTLAPSIVQGQQDHNFALAEAAEAANNEDKAVGQSDNMIDLSEYVYAIDGKTWKADGWRSKLGNKLRPTGIAKSKSFWAKMGSLTEWESVNSDTFIIIITLLKFWIKVINEATVQRRRYTTR